MATRSRTSITRRASRSGRSPATVEAVIETAANLLLSQGWAAATLAQIAERAGVDTAALARNFPDKTAIVAEVASRRIAMEVATIESALATGGDDDGPAEHASDLHPPGSPRAALLAMVADMAERQSQSMVLDAALREQLDPAVLGELLRAAEAKVVRLTGKYLARHAASVRSADHATAFVLVHALRGILAAAATHEPRLLRSNDFRRATAALVDRYLFPT